MPQPIHEWTDHSLRINHARYRHLVKRYSPDGEKPNPVYLNQAKKNLRLIEEEIARRDLNASQT